MCALPFSFEYVVAVPPPWPLVINCGCQTVLRLVNTVDGVYKSALYFQAPGQALTLEKRGPRFSFLPVSLVLASAQAPSDAKPSRRAFVVFLLVFPWLFVFQGWVTGVDYEPAAFSISLYEVAPLGQRRVGK